MRPQDERLQALIAEQAAEWYVAHRAGPLAPPQAQAFVLWLRASPLHVAEYLAIAAIARDVGDAARQNTTSLPLLREAGVQDRVVPFDDAWSLRGDKFPADGSSPRAAARQRPRAAAPARRSRFAAGRRRDVAASSSERMRPLLRRGAVVAALALAVGIIFVGLPWFASRPQVQKYAARHGEQRSLQLPDNTVVRLNSDSAIAISFDRRRRHVDVIRGQAYFEVAKDPARPFGVRVDGLLIEDVGTAFDVYRQNAGTTVTVAEGQVQIWHAPAASLSSDWSGLDRLPSPSQGRPIADLAAGRQVRIAASGQLAAEGRVDVQQATAWIQGSIAFEHRPLAAVAAEFNRYNNLQIRVDDPHIGALPISGSFDAHDVPAFVAFLNSMPGVQADRHGQSIVVVAGRTARRHRG